MSELPRRLVVPITTKYKDGNEHEVDRIVYVRERTCHMVKHELDVSAWNAGLAEDDPERIVSAYCWECSECGEKLDQESWHYCPKCGARIVRSAAAAFVADKGSDRR